MKLQKQTLKKRITALSLGYWFSATNLGMLLHPYKTVRDVVRIKEFSPLIFSPLVWMIVFWGLALVSVLLGRMIASEWSIFYPRWFYDVLEFCFWWAVWFLGWWQVLVLYLYLRFKTVLR
jgi:hypothetical protein